MTVRPGWSGGSLDGQHRAWIGHVAVTTAVSRVKHDQLGSTAGIDLTAPREVEAIDLGWPPMTTATRFE